MSGESWALFSEKLGYDTIVHAEEDPRKWPEPFAKLYREWYAEIMREIRVEQEAAAVVGAMTAMF